MPDAVSNPGGALRTDGAIPPLAWAGVALAALAGVAGRTLADSPLWLDEALSVNIAGLPLGRIDDALRSDGHPPLYYWLLHAWMAVVGDGDGAARSLSVVLGVAALPLGWIVGRRVGGPATGAWTVVLLAITPYAVRYGSEARMYSLVMLLVLAGAALVPIASRRPRPVTLAGLAAVVAALVLTHYWSLYLVATTIGVLLWRWRTDVERRDAWARVLVAVGAGGLAFTVWVPVFVDQMAHTGTPWALPARPAQIVFDSLSELGTGGVDLFAEGGLLGVILAVLLFVGVLGSVRAADGTVALTASPAGGVRDLAVVAFATLALGAVVGRATGSTFNSRYAAVVVPLLLVLAAAGLGKLPSRWPAIGAGVAVVALSLAGTVKVATTDRTEAGDLAARIAAGARAGDVAVACPDQLGVSLARALAEEGADVPVLPYPDLDGDPRFVRWRDYEERNDAADPAGIAGLLDSRAQGAIWLVWNGSYRTFEGDCEALINTLGTFRGATVAGPVPTERAFEHGDLIRFAAP